MTCRFHNVNPQEWIEEVFHRLEEMKPSQYHTYSLPTELEEMIFRDEKMKINSAVCWWEAVG